MSSSVGRKDGFYSAAQARRIAIGGGSANSVVLTEINALQEAIDTAATGGALTVTITTTTMTTSEDYYNAWNDYLNYAEDSDKLLRYRMNDVVNYFSSLGYTIRREQVDTSSLFEWVIRW